MMNKKNEKVIKMLREKNSYLRKKLNYQKKKAFVDLAITVGLIVAFAVMVYISTLNLFGEEVTEFINAIEVPYLFVLFAYLLSKELNRNNLVFELEKEYYYNCLELKKLTTLEKEESDFMSLAMDGHWKEKIIRIFKKSLYFVKF